MRRINILPILFILPVLCVFGQPTASKAGEEASQTSSADSRGGIVSFSAKIASERADVCSSPGEENSYSTGSLRSGDMVEVFYRTADGWCAIRPPEGSFSWISGAFVQQEGETSGMVVLDQPDKEVPVRVGADSVLRSSGVQIGLKNGRRVQILGETTLTGGKRWFKITPPSGEFRWIRDQDLTPGGLPSNIPSRLTRESDYFAQNGNVEELPAAFIPKPTDPDRLRSGMGQKEPDREMTLPQSTEQETIAERMRERPNRPQEPDGAQSDPASPVNANPTPSPTYPAPKLDDELLNKNFSLEMTRLNRDLFTAIERSGSPEVFDLLSDRAVSLYRLTDDDSKRAEVQKIFDRIEQCRENRANVRENAEKTNPSAAPQAVAMAGGILPNGTGDWTDAGAQVLYRAPSPRVNGESSGRLVRENDQIVFTPATTAPTHFQTAAPSVNEAEKAPRPDQVRFAFADGNHPFAGFSRAKTVTNGREPKKTAALFSGKPSTIVPPANYRPAPLLPGDSSSAGKTSAKPVEPRRSIGERALPTGTNDRGDSASPPPRKVPILATDAPASSDDAIRPVAHFVRPQGVDGEEVENRSELTADESADGGQTGGTVPLSVTPVKYPIAKESGVITGVLGRIPNPSDGTPAYALVKNDGQRLVIVCYVAPDEGKSLDPFIGKKIGVTGTRSWLKRGEENRKMITAKAIYLLD